MKKAYGLALLSGLAWALSAAPRDFPPIGFLGAPLLLAAFELAEKEGVRARGAFMLGFASGFVCNVVVLGWVVKLLQVFGHFPLVGAVPTGALLWAAQALPFAFSTLGLFYLVRVKVPAWLALPAMITIATAITPALFPWHIATSQVPFTMYIQLAEVGGTPLLDFLLALAGCAAWAAYRQRSRPIAMIAAAAFLIPVVYGAIRLPMVTLERNMQKLTRVGVAQPNVGIDEKHNPALMWQQFDDLQAITRELETENSNLVVWPETAYPFAIAHDARRDQPGPDALIQDGVHGPLLFGSITRERDHLYNSAVAMLRGGEIVGIADKVTLLAFGEYVPFWDDLPILRRFFPRRGLTAGEAPRALQISDSRIGVLICYEDVLDARARDVMRTRPDYLVNITNDAWFGDTEPFLHQSVARLRAVETRRDLVRAVNTGVSSHISSTGEELVATTLNHRTFFIADVRHSGMTTPWVMFGDVLTPTLAALLLAWTIYQLRKQRMSELTAKSQKSE